MKDILKSFGLPALALLLCFILLICGINGEVKAMMAVIVGWIAREGTYKLSDQNLKALSDKPG